MVATPWEPMKIGNTGRKGAQRRRAAESNEVRTGKHAFDLVTMSPIREGTIPKPFLQMNSGSLDPMEFTVFQKITHSWEIECTSAWNQITVSHQATMA